MRRARLISLGALALACASAQQSRDAMRQAYQAWKQVDPDLERDAAKGGADITARAQKVSEAASKYAAAKQAYFESREAALKGQSDALPEFTIQPSADDKRITDYIGLEMSTVNAGIEALGNDPDPGIKQLRQMMEREKAALANVSSGIRDRQSAIDAAERSAEQVEQQRMGVVEHLHSLAAAIGQAGVPGSAPSWVDYYRSLGAGRAPAGPAVSAVKPAVTGNTGATGAVGASSPVRTTSSAASPVSPTSGGSPANINPPVSRSPAAVPLSRYVGGWTYMKPSSIYRGVEPEFVDLVVHEENGQMSGTLYGRFKAPPGTDPVLRFDFSGPIQNTRNQTFVLTTSDSAKGAIELIPGPAFNLLEVNFGTDPAPGKIRQGNFILIKK